MTDHPNLAPELVELPTLECWAAAPRLTHPPRILLLYGSLRERSYSRLLTDEAARLGAVRPTQGKTLAVMQICGGSQSFNVVNQLRVLGRWMRCCGASRPWNSLAYAATVTWSGDPHCAGTCSISTPTLDNWAKGPEWVRRLPTR